MSKGMESVLLHVLWSITYVIRIYDSITRTKHYISSKNTFFELLKTVHFTAGVTSVESESTGSLEEQGVHDLSFFILKSP